MSIPSREGITRTAGCEVSNCAFLARFRPGSTKRRSTLPERSASNVTTYRWPDARKASSRASRSGSRVVTVSPRKRTVTGSASNVRAVRAASAAWAFPIAGGART